MSTLPRLSIPPEPARTSEQQVLAKIGASRGTRWGRKLLRWIVVLAVVGGGGWVAYDRLLAPEPTPIVYRRVAIDRGDLDVTVTATGSLQPQGVVTVGGEISGRVATVEVDFNDRVTKGQVLVRLDQESLRNALAEAEASLAVARTEVARAKAAREHAEALAKRTRDLATRGLVSAEEDETASSSATLARADETRAASSLAQARTRVQQAKTNLQKSVIVSPIDGVVLTRSVEPGNAIAASLAAPELFVLAEDLAHMELHLGIDEADVGQVREGQEASFTVDAFPGRTFAARVETVRLAPAATDTNSTVVTYTAVLTVDNAEGLLRPGMTASASIVTAHHEDVVRVPNAALRFSPNQETAKAAAPSSNPFQMTQQMGRMGRFGPQRRSTGATETAEGSRGGGRGAVWVLVNGEPARVRVELGPSDGRFTVIRTDAPGRDPEARTIAPGDEVLVGVEAQAG